MDSRTIKEFVNHVSRSLTTRADVFVLVGDERGVPTGRAVDVTLESKGNVKTFSLLVSVNNTADKTKQVKSAMEHLRAEVTALLTPEQK